MYTYIDLEYMQETIEPNSEGNKEGGGGGGSGVLKTTIRFTFRSKNPDGDRVIDQFIQEAFDFYLKKMKDTKDFSRYLYMLVKTPSSSSGSGDDNNGDQSGAAVRVYKRYKLSDEKVCILIYTYTLIYIHI